ncbi:hypothetical protein [Cedecea neteri]|uniref:hypothetical protein n=1 Tax=Cedecea neteri TaxID=158822 RepID=UPI0028A00B63|nr:hypothetical protein [Cedecea neteri]
MGLEGKFEKSDAHGMAELVGFQITFSALAEKVMLKAQFRDSMQGVPMWPTSEFPDQEFCMSRREAESLLRELKKAIDYIDAGIEHPAMRGI